MKREELKEKIYEICHYDNDCHDETVDELLSLIDEYTKPKTKKKSCISNDLIALMDFDKAKELGIWLQYRKSIKKTVRAPETLKRLAKKFNDTDIETIKQVVNHSIDNQYQGLFWDKFKNNGNKPTTTQNRNATEDDINNYINS